MSLSVIPLTILGQITGVTGSGETALYQVSFKSIDGTPLYGVTAGWTDEQAEIEALAAQKPYGVWINPIDGTFTVKFADYTYVGTADLTDADVLAGVTTIEFITTEVSDRLLPEVTAEDNGKTLAVINEKWESIGVIRMQIPDELAALFGQNLQNYISNIISADGKFRALPTVGWSYRAAVDKDSFTNLASKIKIAAQHPEIIAYLGDDALTHRKILTHSADITYRVRCIASDVNVSTYRFFATYSIYYQEYADVNDDAITMSVKVALTPSAQ